MKICPCLKKLTDSGDSTDSSDSTDSTDSAIPCLKIPISPRVSWAEAPVLNAHGGV